MNTKITFTIQTRMSDEKIKDTIVDNNNIDESDVSVWSPINMIPLPSILMQSSTDDDPHITFIDIQNDNNWLDFDELYWFIREHFDVTKEDVKFEKKRNCEASSKVKYSDPYTERAKKAGLKETDMYCFTIDHVKDGITLDNLEEIISEKLKEEHAVFSSIFEDAPSFESVDAFQYNKDGAIVYITAHYRFFEWISFENLKAFVKENVEKPEETVKHSYSITENNGDKIFEVFFKTNSRDEFEFIEEVVRNMVDYKED